VRDLKIRFCVVAAIFLSAASAANPSPEPTLESFIKIEDFFTCDLGDEFLKFNRKTFPASNEDQTPTDIMAHIPAEYRNLFVEKPSMLGPNGAWYYNFETAGTWNGLKLKELRVGVDPDKQRQFFELIFAESGETIRDFLDRDWRNTSEKHEKYKAIGKSSLRWSVYGDGRDESILSCDLPFYRL
jgi:hypothetical protein